MGYLLHPPLDKFCYKDKIQISILIMFHSLNEPDCFLDITSKVNVVFIQVTTPINFNFL